VQGLTGVARLALADVRDPSVLESVFDRERPEVVFHAAAHKHVPILEDYACEAIRTNVFGTLNVLDACARAGTAHLVCISTDKAASPSSVMGASKWLAEQIVLERAPRAGYCSVRFGNVLGSRGSVIPTFQRQIAVGGPVTVTDPRMTRYFMSTDEAVKLVLLGAAIAGDHKVLALEMGEQVNIYALAERMIRLCGLRPHDDIEIAITGMRPGEKLAEAVFSPAEGRAPAHGEALLSIEPVPLGASALAAALEQLEVLAVNGDDVGARVALLGYAHAAAAAPIPSPAEESVRPI
jgi:FlaA1/EpsC-like NDP-sugar epimerase